jgi:hypothetical protein
VVAVRYGVMVRLAAVALAAVLSLALPASAAARSWDAELTHTTSCFEGHTPRLEWRVQLGVFADGLNAYDFEEKLGERGIDTEVYFGKHGGQDVYVVVSPEYPSAGTAARAASRLRHAVGGAFVRRFRHWW